MPISVDKAVIARYEKFGKKFEILVDPEKAVDFRSGKTLNVEEILAVEEIFEDAKKGLRASREELKKVFGSENVKEITEKILKFGEIQITAEQRRKMLEEKKKYIATLIAKQAINPQTNTPHTVERILNAMELAKVQIDIYKSPEDQVNAVIEAIQRIIPIRFEKIELQIKVSAMHAGKCYGVIKEFGKIKKEEWLNDGSLICIIEIPAGMQTDIFDKLNKITHGDVIIQQIQKKVS